MILEVLVSVLFSLPTVLTILSVVSTNTDIF